VTTAAAGETRGDGTRPDEQLVMSSARAYASGMRTLVLDSSLPEMEALLAHRKTTGIDRRDEVWEGVLHLVPATNLNHARIARQLQLVLDDAARAAGLELLMQEFNLGDSIDNYRVPDGGIFRPGTEGTWISTAAMVIEIVSPDDETWEKLPHFAARGVDEVVIVDPGKQRVDWLALRRGQYVPTKNSALIDFGPTALSARIEWP
jgi:Uma2 family endonuclease